MILRKKFIFRLKIEGLISFFLVVVNVWVMLIWNCNVEDGFVNGVMGKILYFLLKDGNVDYVFVVGVLFDNMNVG